VGIEYSVEVRMAQFGMGDDRIDPGRVVVIRQPACHFTGEFGLADRAKMVRSIRKIAGSAFDVDALHDAVSA
jgi:hypothetical protein